MTVYLMECLSYLGIDRGSISFSYRATVACTPRHLDRYLTTISPTDTLVSTYTFAQYRDRRIRDVLTIHPNIFDKEDGSNETYRRTR